MMRIIWVDDDWAGEYRETLDALRQDIEETLRSAEVYVSWDIVSDPIKAYKKIDQNVSNYTFAILDLDFLDEDNPDQYKDADELFFKLREKKIYYAIYSNFADKKKNNDSYCIGSYKKGVDRQDRLIQDLKSFFDCPPFRILQISDIHYDVNMSKGDTEIFLRSLEETLTALHKEKKIDIITMTGDYAATKPAEELILIGNKLKQIFTNIKISDERIFLVPGNHEVIWQDFSKRVLSSAPYSGYVSFLKSILTRTPLSSINAWAKNDLRLEVSADDLTWHRTLKIPQVSIIGICSNSADLDKQGMGVLSEKNIEYIRYRWALPKKLNELRILLLHHNFFPVQSFNSRDENRTLINAGTALNALVQNNCDLILSGHTHRSEVILYQSASLSGVGYSYNKTLLLVAAGTSGGVPSTGDFAKNFNIIDISKNVSIKKMRLNITPFLYDSRIGQWERKQFLEYYLSTTSL